MQSSKSTIIFYHIPKTGGMSLNTSIGNINPKKHMCGTHDWKGAESYTQMDERSRSYVRFLSGHFPHSYDQWSPVPYLSVTILRDPVERILSLNRYRKHLGGSDLDIFGSGLDNHNGMTRRLSGSDWNTPTMTTMHLEAAKLKLKTLGCVGFTERMPALYSYLGKLLDRDMTVIHNNKTDHNLPLLESRSLVTSQNAVDAELYAWGRDYFGDVGGLGWQEPQNVDLELETTIKDITKNIGLGDIIAKATSAVGIKPCGGCKKRKEKLNKLFPLL